MQVPKTGSTNYSIKIGSHTSHYSADPTRWALLKQEFEKFISVIETGKLFRFPKAKKIHSQKPRHLNAPKILTCEDFIQR